MQYNLYNKAEEKNNTYKKLSTRLSSSTRQYSFRSFWTTFFLYCGTIYAVLHMSQPYQSSWFYYHAYLWFLINIINFLIGPCVSFPSPHSFLRRLVQNSCYATVQRPPRIIVYALHRFFCLILHFSFSSLHLFIILIP